MRMIAIREIAFCTAPRFIRGNASIYDIHNPADVKLIGQVKTPFEFTHNIWLSDNSQYMFTTDERANSYVASYDITNPGNIIELDRYPASIN
jgi:hypothetical protein